ncbi:hypothetical protein E2C01_021104 [Portunus trituberculatus]|uniref:Uncharacterized protein n=1 Tax=Portunus trituberculatus TaxID=210409 RepID=A0A5B7E3H4_PORTR|nr:hypothetical protein [Portunus trituberculatus]
MVSCLNAHNKLHEAVPDTPTRRAVARGGLLTFKSFNRPPSRLHARTAAQARVYRRFIEHCVRIQWRRDLSAQTPRQDISRLSAPFANQTA